MNYNKLKEICTENSELGRKLVDDVLIPFGLQRKDIQKMIRRDFGRYNHAFDQLKVDHKSMFLAQFIAHTIFKRGGLINKFMNQDIVQGLDGGEIDFLRSHQKNPWSFRFAEIRSNPATDFYEMVDVFRGEKFLLYSPAITEILDDKNVVLWSILTQKYGDCFQTFGPVIGHSGIFADDVFFFATELNHHLDITTDEEVATDIERNPAPYMALIIKSELPVVVSKDHQIVNCFAEYDEPDFQPQKLKEYFEIEYNAKVVKLTPKNIWSDHPHFADAYYDGNEQLLRLQAMTDAGYAALARMFRDQGYDFEPLADFRVTPVMTVLAKEVLNRKVEVLPYNKYFADTSSPEQQKSLDKLNKFMNKLLPYINEGQIPADLEQLAEESGIAPESANSIYMALKEQLKK